MNTRTAAVARIGNDRKIASDVEQFCINHVLIARKETQVQP
jgi:hypothetical protein